MHFFIILFKKENHHKFHIHYINRNHSSYFCHIFNSDYYGLNNAWKIRNLVFRIIRQLPKINHKKIYNTEMSCIWKVCSFTQSILDSLTLNYYISVVWYGGEQPVPLLSIYWSQGCFDSGLQLFCIFGCSSWRYLLTFSIGLRSGELAGQSSTVIS